MNNSTLRTLPQPETKPADLLTGLLRAGARDMIAQAVESELQALLEYHYQRKLPDGHQAVVRNGYLPERTIQTEIGDVEIKVPKVRAPASALTAHCYRPICIPQGISTGDVQEALGALLGEQARGAADTTSRLKQCPGVSARGSVR